MAGSGDSEKKMFSITKSMDATAAATSNLMATMTALNKSKIWTIFSRGASGIFPQVWQIQNKFRAVTDAFVGYDKHINKARESTLEKMKTFSALQDQLDMFPDVLFDENFFDMVGLENWIDIAKDELEEFPFFQLLAKDDTGTREDLMDMLSGRKKEMTTKRDKLREEHEEEKKKMAPLKKALEGLDPKKDKMKMFWETLKFKIKLLVTGAAAFFKGALMWFAGIAIVLALIIGWFKLSAPMLKGAWEFIKASLTLVVEGVIQIVKGFIWMIQGALTGDIELVLKGLFEGILLGAFKILIGLVGTLIGVAGAIVIGLLGPIMGKLGLIENSVTDIKSWFGVLGSILIVLGAIVAILGAPAFIGTFLYSAAFTIGRAIALLIVGAFLKLIGSAHTGGMRSGLTLVGERGPELVTLPKGSRVHSNAESRRMAGGNTIHVHINGRLGASDIEIRDIADKVGREINLRMNRTSNTQMRF